MNNAEPLQLDAVSPYLESGAYESLWMQPRQSFKRLAEAFHNSTDESPLDLVDEDQARHFRQQVDAIFEQKDLRDVGFLVQGIFDFPAALLDARYPLRGLYYRGNLNLLSEPVRVAVVGTRQATAEGLQRVRQVVRGLVKHRAVVVSGLAAGIDTAALKTALEFQGDVIGVIGTPITEVYPRENANLQQRIAQEHLLVSQVPILRYLSQGSNINRSFFPERNVTMSAISDATIIVEASDTSGTLYQARAAIDQKRKLFILNSCFEQGLKWPEKYEALGAIRVRSFEDIESRLFS